MESSKMPSAFLFFVVLVSMGHLSQAQNSPNDYLIAHNIERAKLGLPPFTWNNTVAEYAQNYANIRSQDCDLIHSQAPDYGENIAYGWGNFSAAQVVKLWVPDEKPNYDYKSNSCIGGKQCLHYTQGMWRDTKQIGCARIQCNNKPTAVELAAKVGKRVFFTCNYYPPGNWVGARPY